jgi:hypothetical protein
VRVTYIHQYFTTPEQGGGTRSYEMGRRLVKMGHQVRMVTTRRESGFGGWRVRTVEGMEVHELGVPYSNRMGNLRRIGAFLQFAIMGYELVKAVENQDHPRVGLLNIGEEEIKGNEQVKQAAKLLAESHINFVGFVEGNDIFSGEVDVVVTDGFTGNIFLKTLEGSMKMAKNILTKSFRSNISSMIGYSFAKSSVGKYLANSLRNVAAL